MPTRRPVKINTVTYIVYQHKYNPLCNFQVNEKMNELSGRQKELKKSCYKMNSFPKTKLAFSNSYFHTPSMFC